MEPLWIYIWFVEKIVVKIKFRIKTIKGTIEEREQHKGGGKMSKKGQKGPKKGAKNKQSGHTKVTQNK